MNARVLMLGFFTIGCGASGTDGASTTDTGSSDFGAIDVGATETGPSDTNGDDAGCRPGDPCLYVSAERYEVEDVGRHVVSDATRVGQNRSIPVFIRVPKGAPAGKLPVVVWSHGGADGSTSPEHSGEDWCPIFTQAGYVTIAIAHPGRDKAERLALCAAVGISSTDCEFFKFLSYDRPHDVSKVLDALPALEAAFPALAGRIDLDRIAMAGHSAGAGGTLMIGGASRVIGPSPRTYDDPRPKALLAFSPQGPGEDGFTESSFGTVLRPTLIGTGQGDDTADTRSESRLLVFDRLPAKTPEDKYRFYIDDPAAIHATFDHEPDKSKPEHLAWLTSIAVAFVDGYVKARPEALAYLRSQSIALVSGGIASWAAK